MCVCGLGGSAWPNVSPARPGLVRLGDRPYGRQLRWSLGPSWDLDKQPFVFVDAFVSRGLRRRRRRSGQPTWTRPTNAISYLFILSAGRRHAATHTTFMRFLFYPAQYIEMKTSNGRLSPDEQPASCPLKRTTSLAKNSYVSAVCCINFVVETLIPAWGPRERERERESNRHPYEKFKGQQICAVHNDWYHYDWQGRFAKYFHTYKQNEIWERSRKVPIAILPRLKL